MRKYWNEDNCQSINH
ncbi:hypothetical protein D4M42_11705 [Enterococcus gallinarum]|nr:hypothetical protein DXA88_04525 [Enterococcus gallinarum]TXW59507.1 hypothetical protein D4M64_12035 [Enterococcus gallinarum]TXX11982.1 hypothetical protein D4M42_11705 [Enterococcus gallinarum]